MRLTEQEVLSLKQLVLTPGADALMKLLQIAAAEAQDKAMSCNSPKMEDRAVAQMQAQIVREVVGQIIKTLVAYRESMNPLIPEPEDLDPMGLNIFNQRTN